MFYIDLNIAQLLIFIYLYTYITYKIRLLVIIFFLQIH